MSEQEPSLSQDDPQAAGRLPATGQDPDWPRAVYFMMKAIVHTLRSIDTAGTNLGLEERWWESSIEAEYEAMLAAGEAKEEARPSEEAGLVADEAEATSS